MSHLSSRAVHVDHGVGRVESVSGTDTCLHSLLYGDEDDTDDANHTVSGVAPASSPVARPSRPPVNATIIDTPSRNTRLAKRKQQLLASPTSAEPGVRVRHDASIIQKARLPTPLRSTGTTKASTQLQTSVTGRQFYVHQSDSCPVTIQEFVEMLSYLPLRTAEAALPMFSRLRRTWWSLQHRCSTLPWKPTCIRAASPQLRFGLDRGPRDCDLEDQQHRVQHPLAFSHVFRVSLRWFLPSSSVWATMTHTWETAYV